MVPPRSLERRRLLPHNGAMGNKSKGSESHRPFKVLRELVDRGEIDLAPETDKLISPPSNLDDSLTDDEAFHKAMEEVRPLGWSDVPLELPRPIEIAERADDEPEALARLQALVEGRGELDPFATGEGIEGAATRRGRAHLPRLKKGDYSVQAHLDLHGLALSESNVKVEAFIRASQRRGHCCVRIVHGRGKHSSSEPAVLKTHLTRLLSSKKMSRYVVAFASARWTDGGSGAVYVLLYGKMRPLNS
jgi:DNA-nicking Smr family endonuclease